MITDLDSMYATYPLNQNLNDTIGSQHGTNSGTVYAAGKFKTGLDFDTVIKVLHHLDEERRAHLTKDFLNAFEQTCSEWE
jgi:hypothetical protein